MRRVPLYNYFTTQRDNNYPIALADLNYLPSQIPASKFHSLEHYDISFIYEGRGDFSVNEQTHTVAPGDIIFSRPGDIRAWDAMSLTGGRALLFDDVSIQTLFSGSSPIESMSCLSPARQSARLSLTIVQYRNIRVLLSELKTELLLKKKNRTRICAFLSDIFTLLQAAYTDAMKSLPDIVIPSNRTRHIHVSEFFRLVNTELCREHSIQYYAGRMGITPNYLNEIMKRSIGINAKQYIQNSLIIEAKRRLAHTDQPILLISEELNFDTLAYFIRFFHRQTELTPQQYRAMLHTSRSAV
ncbi:MAG: AraC family transcriptional regulator [Tannerellaceae bacterium]|jgi:AraC-like DNA-binding protein|nr:AraC family transcriptional regulator [Tannerellaceae bacterium]